MSAILLLGLASAIAIVSSGKKSSKGSSGSSGGSSNLGKGDGNAEPGAQEFEFKKATFVRLPADAGLSESIARPSGARVWGHCEVPGVTGVGVYAAYGSETCEVFWNAELDNPVLDKVIAKELSSLSDRELSKIKSSVGNSQELMSLTQKIVWDVFPSLSGKKLFRKANREEVEDLFGGRKESFLLTDFRGKRDPVSNARLDNYFPHVVFNFVDARIRMMIEPGWSPIT